MGAGGLAAAETFSMVYAAADVAGPLAWIGHAAGGIIAFGVGYHYASKAGNKIYTVTVDGLSGKPKTFSGFGSGSFGGGGAGGSFK